MAVFLFTGVLRATLFQLFLLLPLASLYSHLSSLLLNKVNNQLEARLTGLHLQRNK
jgi:hypothetical protein